MHEKDFHEKNQAADTVAAARRARFDLVQKSEALPCAERSLRRVERDVDVKASKARR